MTAAPISAVSSSCMQLGHTVVEQQQSSLLSVPVCVTLQRSMGRSPSSSAICGYRDRVLCNAHPLDSDAFLTFTEIGFCRVARVFIYLSWEREEERGQEGWRIGKEIEKTGER